MGLAIDPGKMEADASAYFTTTLYDLMVALHDVVAPHEDHLVVAIVANWVRAGRITLLGDAVSGRLQRSATLALCRWGFPPPLTPGESLPWGTSQP